MSDALSTDERLRSSLARRQTPMDWYCRRSPWAVSLAIIGDGPDAALTQTMDRTEVLCYRDETP